MKVVKIHLSIYLSNKSVNLSIYLEDKERQQFLLPFPYHEAQISIKGHFDLAKMLEMPEMRKSNTRPIIQLKDTLSSKKT